MEFTLDNANNSPSQPHTGACEVMIADIEAILVVPEPYWAPAGMPQLTLDPLDPLGSSETDNREMATPATYHKLLHPRSNNRQKKKQTLTGWVFKLEI